MKYALHLLLTLALPSPFVWSQTPVDTTLTLQNIEIQGKQYGGLMGGEVRRVLVDRNLSGLTGTTADVFRQLPSVVTDIEGGITYRGSNHPGLLINGVPYGLMEENSGDMLIQLPALFFNRISMTSMPAIELVPDGDAGVLNLSSSPFTREESPLIVTWGGGFQERYNAGAIVNLHPGKFHIIGKYNYRREYRKRTFSKITTNKAGTTAMNNNASARPDIHLADLTVGYDLSANDRFTLYGLYSLMDYSRYGKIQNSKLSPDGAFKPVMFRHRYNDQQQQAYAAEARWNHTFSDPQEQLNVTFNYNHFGYDEGNDYENENPASGQLVAQDNYEVRQNKQLYYLSVLYGKMFESDWYLRAGYLGRFRKEEYKAEGHKLVSGEWLPDSQKENESQLLRRTHLLYLLMAKKWKAFSAEAGVQGELNWQKRDSRFHLYPRLKLAYQTDKAGELSLSYVQRVVRPYGNDLNLFTDYSDATHLKQGNPDLKDEQIHVVEFSYAFSAPTWSMTPALYYRNKQNRIMEIAKESADGKQTIWQMQNIGHAQILGFELSTTWRPVSILSFGLSGNLYRDEIDGRNIGYNEKKSMMCGDIKGSVHLRITPTTELQLDGFYLSDQLTPQGEVKHRSSVNAGLSQYFMQRKLRANLSVNNLFNGLEETTVIDTPDLKMTQVRNRDAQLTWLTLTYKL